MATLHQTLDLVDKQTCNESETCNFCKGSPGAIPMLTLALEVFPEMGERLLSQAENIGEELWLQVPKNI